MNLRFFLTSAGLVFGASLVMGAAIAQDQPSLPQNPYGGTTVANIVARVNDLVITNMDYNRALHDLEQEAQQSGDSMQQGADERNNLLRNMIDQKLWLSKGKQLDITGDTDLIKRLDDIRKQYHLATIDDLQKAAQAQGVSFADFKANLRDQIVTQNVMRQEVGSKIDITPGEVRQYYDQHKQQYVSPESERLNEILISTSPKPSDPDATSDQSALLAAAKAKADDIEARLNAGGSFTQLARSFSNGPTAADGGDLGVFRRADLAGELGEKTFALKAGQWTTPILTRQGYVILEVAQHNPGGVQPFSQVETQVENALYSSRMEPAIRAYLTQMREEAFIDIAPGYADTGASPDETKPVFSTYVPPSPKKKHKIERTRYREIGSRGKVRLSASAPRAEKERSKITEQASERPGKKEKIRYGQAPRETLPPAVNSDTNIENGGALPESAYNSLEGVSPAESTPPPVESAPPRNKNRYWDLARQDKEKKPKEKREKRVEQPASFTPAPPTAAEVANRETQSTPLGLNGNTAAKHKKKPASTGKKVRFSQEKEEKKSAAPLQPTPVPPVLGAPAPAPPPAQ